MDHEKPDLPELLMRNHQLMHRYHLIYQRPESDEIDPRQGQGRLLLLLQRLQSVTQRDLGRMLNIRQQSLGELLMKLERGGYITRSPDETDRRTMRIVVTEKGRQQLFQRVDFTPIFDCLTDEEQETLANILHRLISTLDEQLKKDDPRDPCCRQGLRDFPCPPPSPPPWIFDEDDKGGE